MRAGQDSAEPRGRVPAPPAPPAGIVGAGSGRFQSFLPKRVLLLERPTGQGEGGRVPRHRGRSPAPGAAARTAAAPWRPPRARGPQGLLRDRRQPPSRSAQPLRPL